MATVDKLLNRPDKLAVKEFSFIIFIFFFLKIYFFGLDDCVIWKAITSTILYNSFHGLLDVQTLNRLEGLQSEMSFEDVTPVPSWAVGIFLSSPIYSSWEKLKAVHDNGDEAEDHGFRSRMEFLIMKTQADFVRDLEAFEGKFYRYTAPCA